MPYGRLPTLVVKDTPQERSRFEMKFDLLDTDVSMANAVRRVMISEVPTIAIEEVTVLENTSPLHDEYITHRLGLIPLESSRVDELEYSRDCEECEDFCPNCAVQFELNVTSEQNSGVRKVTSGDLVLLSSEERSAASSVVPIHDSGDDSDQRGGTESRETGILIAKLSRGQRLHMTMIARKGIGKEHAKWSPMCTVAYRIVPPAVELVLEKINSLLNMKQKRELLAASQGLLKMDENLGYLEYETPFKVGRIGITPDTTRKAGELALQAGGTASDVVKYNPEPERFEFCAETSGAISPQQTLRMALEILSKKIDTLAANLR